LQFPAALREIEVMLFGPDVSPADFNFLLQSVGRLPLLQSLRLGVSLLPSVLISFAPLVALRQLRSFSVGFECDEEEEDEGEYKDRQLSDAQVDELRALPWLHKVRVIPMAAATLRRLLRQPHQLQWREIRLPYPLDDEITALLPQLPSFTDLGDLWTSCTRFDWLRGLPNLTLPSLSPLEPLDADGTHSLSAALQGCVKLESMYLSESAGLTQGQLVDLLPRLPLLRELFLCGPAFDSLAFLAQEPLAQRLTDLSLFGCSRLPLTELRHVHALSNLQVLNLWKPFSAPLDEATLLQYEPPSALMPQLRRFSYQQPESVALGSDSPHSD
jgi:hypothetical protein